MYIVHIEWQWYRYIKNFTCHGAHNPFGHKDIGQLLQIHWNSSSPLARLSLIGLLHLLLLGQMLLGLQLTPVDGLLVHTPHLLWKQKLAHGDGLYFKKLDDVVVPDISRAILKAFVIHAHGKRHLSSNIELRNNFQLYTFQVRCPRVSCLLFMSQEAIMTKSLNRNIPQHCATLWVPWTLPHITICHPSPDCTGLGKVHSASSFWAFLLQICTKGFPEQILKNRFRIQFWKSAWCVCDINHWRSTLQVNILPMRTWKHVQFVDSNISSN